MGTFYSFNYKFSKQNYSYKLPILNVDLEFIALRREEIKVCIKNLNDKIATIDITSREGIRDFTLANHLVQYYFMASRLISYKENELINGPAKDRVYTEEEARKITSRND